MLKEIDMEPEQFIGHLFDTLTDKELDAYNRKHRRYGAIQNRVRVETVARYCAEHWEGDLVEIGCLYGGNTVRLAQVAREYDRRVIAVDPFVIEPYYAQNVYELFCGAVAPWRDILDEIKLSSLSAEAIDYVKGRQLCFVYVDGLHSYGAAACDIRTTAHCAGIISVDDIIEWVDKPGSNMGTRRAFDEGSVALHRKGMSHYLCREGYLLPLLIGEEHA